SSGRKSRQAILLTACQVAVVRVSIVSTPPWLALLHEGSNSSRCRRIAGMAGRSSWKGYLKNRLEWLPVKAYTATSSSANVSLNQLHAGCNSRINYKKTCPIHGEVQNAEIVSGYEFTKGQYVVIDMDELEKLRTESDRSITVNKFVKA